MLIFPINRDDIARYCQGHGLTLEQFSNAILVGLTTGVPRDQIGTYMRCWQVLAEMKQEQDAKDLAEHYVKTDRCPTCNSQPRITGGKINHVYCPKCNTCRTDARTVQGQHYYRWSPIAS
jgi:hypothetical protein